jgi:ABC-2 type transport system ATP-binding protein
MLTAQHLTRCYGAFKAVDDVSFTVETGEIVGLLGHNGAGKTTIMKMLSGYLEPDDGRVTFDGVDLASDRYHLQSSLGYLPESLPVYGELTVVDYLDYAAQLKGIDGDERRTELQRVIAATDIASKLSAPVNTLSRGYRQRVGVAQALLGRPRLLILDEPSNGLDPEQNQHMRQLVREVARDATVILSTHIMQEVDALCSRVLILRSGRLALDASLEEVRRSAHVLLETSLDRAWADTALAGLAGVAAVEAGEGAKLGNAYRLILDSAGVADRVLPEIARRVTGAGGDLFRLQPERHDLEHVFRSITEGDVQQEVNREAA